MLNRCSSDKRLDDPRDDLKWHFLAVLIPVRAVLGSTLGVITEGATGQEECEERAVEVGDDVTARAGDCPHESGKHLGGAREREKEREIMR